MPNNFWENKTAIITGSGGFVGCQLVAYLEARNARVTGIVRKTAKRPKEARVDVTSLPELKRIFSHLKPDVCFHLAGETLVESGQTDPYQTLKNNLMGTLNMLELCRAHQVRRLVIASTVHVYGVSALPYAETTPARPSRPYETSKTCADLMAQSYADSFNLPVVIPRFVNIYGPGDLHFSRIIPKTMKSVLTNKSPTLWEGGAVREYLYITDVLRAYDLLAQISDKELEKNRIFNFGSLEAISARDLIEAILKIAGKRVKIKKVAPAREKEISIQQTDWSKAKRILGWKPEVKLTQGLKLTLDWYRDYFKIN